jgi:hypothetical protein
MQHVPITVNPSWQDCRILVLFHHYTLFEDRLEVGGKEIDRRPGGAIGRARDKPVSNPLSLNYPRIFEPPHLMNLVAAATQERFRLDAPT